MDNKTTLYIVRHGESIGNVNGNFNGNNDLPLNDRGIKQAKSLQDKMKNIDFDVIISSPLQRAYQTAKYALNNEEIDIEVINEIKEINGGQWEGTKWLDLPKKWPDVFDNWIYKPDLVKMPDGESMVEFAKRCHKAYEDILNRYKNKTIVTFSHGTVIRVMQVYFRNKPLSYMKNIMWHENTGVFKVEIENDKYFIKKEDDVSHLSSDLRTIRTAKWYKEFEKSVLEGKEGA